MIAGGAGHYRQPGLVERLGRALGTLPVHGAVRARLKRWYCAVLNAQTSGRGLPASLPGGEVVRVLPEHGYLGWNPDEYRAFRDAVRPGMTALDVGANVGAYALLLGQWVGRSGSVYAFEPAPETFDGLVRHVHLNGLEAVVHPVKSAVGRSPATAALLVAGNHGESRLTSAGAGVPGCQGARVPGGSGARVLERTVDVTVTSIDEFCERHGLSPRFIKIDVEGAELDVLRGACETIRRCRGDLALFVEWHPSVWKAIGVSRAEIEDELARQSLEAASIVPSRDPWSVEGLCVRLQVREPTE